MIWSIQLASILTLKELPQLSLIIHSSPSADPMELRKTREQRSGTQDPDSVATSPL